VGKFIVGDVVVTIFPFSDLSSNKRRPALILAEVEFGDLVLCQITSKPYSSKTAIAIESHDFSAGELPVVSYARPDKLFTTDVTLIERVAGTLTGEALEKVLSQVRSLF
jgi:mRNA interferase MazF